MLSNARSRHFRPSDSTPARFLAWLGFTVLAVFLYAMPARVPPFAAFLAICAASIAGGAPSDWALKQWPSVIVLVVAGLFFASFIFESSSLRPAEGPTGPVPPLWATLLFASLLGGYAVIELRRFFLKRRAPFTGQP